MCHSERFITPYRACLGVLKQLLRLTLEAWLLLAFAPCFAFHAHCSQLNIGAVNHIIFVTIQVGILEIAE